MTHRQSYNWRRALNAMDAINLCLRCNTESVCEGTPFLRLEERQLLKHAAILLGYVSDELTTDRRSKDADTIEIHTGDHTEIHRPTIA